MALVLDAPAKVNLHLAVLGRRADGFHEVETVLHTLALGDTLYCELLPSGIDLSIASEIRVGLQVKPDEDNLVRRAARSFLETTGADVGFRFHLVKRIPAGGGLGGGSSDAAAALRLMNASVKEPLSRDRLHQLARGLGADVPFFLAGGTQIGRGIGEDLEPLATEPKLHFLLILPPLGTSTGAVYENLGAQLTRGGAEASIPAHKAFTHKEFSLPTDFPNPLESSALELYPELRSIRRRIEEAGYPEVRMTGSGSTFFLAWSDPRECAAARDALSSLADLDVDLVQTESAAIRFAAAQQPHQAPFPGRG